MPDACEGTLVWFQPQIGTEDSGRLDTEDTEINKLKKYLETTFAERSACVDRNKSKLS